MNNKLHIHTYERSISISLLLLIMLLIIIKVGLASFWSLQSKEPEIKITYLDPVDRQDSTTLNSVEIQKTSPSEAEKIPTQNKKAVQSKDYEKKSRSNNFTIHSFDPNNADSMSLLGLGISSFAIKNLMKYRKAGGRFKQKEDLKKVYGLDEKTYESLRDSIEIKETLIVHEEKTKELSFQDINRANFRDFMSLGCMPSKTASILINFRKSLGAFHSIDQLWDVYGMDSLTMQSCIDRLKVVPKEMNRLDINNASLEELAAFPYISRKLAKGIKNFLYQNGPLESTEDLIKMKIFNEQLIQKISPYLIMNEIIIDSKST